MLFTIFPSFSRRLRTTPFFSRRLRTTRLDCTRCCVYKCGSFFFGNERTASNASIAFRRLPLPPPPLPSSLHSPLCIALSFTLLLPSYQFPNIIIMNTVETDAVHRCGRFGRCKFWRVFSVVPTSVRALTGKADMKKQSVRMQRWKSFTKSKGKFFKLLSPSPLPSRPSTALAPGLRLAALSSILEADIAAILRPRCTNLLVAFVRTPTGL